jgi:serine/threonine protein phosphatase PrpC
VVVIRGNQLIVGHAGDSRCVLSRNGQASALSVDHKPDSESERERVQNAGGVAVGHSYRKIMGRWVTKKQWGFTDFKGRVSISRSIGIVLPGSVFRLLQIIAPKKNILCCDLLMCFTHLHFRGLCLQEERTFTS